MHDTDEYQIEYTTEPGTDFDSQEIVESESNEESISPGIVKYVSGKPRRITIIAEIIDRTSKKK